MLADYKIIQPIAYKILSNSIDGNNFSHAYIFETNGYEEGFDMAVSFAKSILKIDEKNIDENNYSELKIINPDGLQIKKEQILDLQQEFNKKSLVGNNKVYIINQAEKLNDTSSNTILKFIEEPPEGIIAILVTDNVYQLLETIVSRCQIISLNGQANISKDDSTISKIGKYLSNTKEEYEEYINTDNKNRLEIIIKFIKYYEKNGKKTLLHMNEYFFDYFKEKKQVFDVLQVFIFFYKDCLNAKLNCEIEIFNDYLDDINLIVENNDINRLIKKIKVITDNKYHILNNANLNLLMDKLIIELEEGV